MAHPPMFRPSPYRLIALSPYRLIALSPYRLIAQDNCVPPEEDIGKITLLNQSNDSEVNDPITPHPDTTGRTMAKQTFRTTNEKAGRSRAVTDQRLSGCHPEGDGQ
ncbi:hypothetical protein [Edwardsiella tarda]